MKIQFIKYIVSITFILFSLIYSKEPISLASTAESFSSRILPNPMEDRSKGLHNNGEAKSAILNYGNFMNWSEHPSGLWGEYTYVPTLSFMAGVPGQEYSSKYNWSLYETVEDNGTIIRQTWESSDAYLSWFENGDTNFVGILFEAENDDGIAVLFDAIVVKDSISNIYQWGIDDNGQTIFLSAEGENDPNKSSARIGFIYPWAFRPKFIERIDSYDIYDYGLDGIGWTADDEYDYYGANVAESWFTRFHPSVNTDWQASPYSAGNIQNPNTTFGDVFGDSPFSSPNESTPVLAHSNYVETWPINVNNELYWPGWWREQYFGDQPDLWDELGITNCSMDLADPDCWAEIEGEFISATDIYMEFDDRWAHRGNQVTAQNEYEQTGYPLGLKVITESYSYVNEMMDDFIIFEMKIRNESGDYYDDEGVLREGLEMPDEQKLNNGKGFNYKGVSLGFYFDADVVSTDYSGNIGPHTNDDDMMAYYDCLTDQENPCIEVNGQLMRVSMALFYDLDGTSNSATEIGIVGTQVLETPEATDPIDLNQDGIIDIYPGEALRMTDWHWFDWYNRPGVVSGESNGNCCAGDQGRPQASNKEEIMYKLMTGDTTNLSADEKDWFFHTPNHDTDLDSELNPHFDSLEGLEAEYGTTGLDGVLMMNSGPFDLDVGEEVTYSLGMIFGQNLQSIIENASHLQGLYAYHFSNNIITITSPVEDEVISDFVSIDWDYNSITGLDVNSTDILYLPFNSEDWDTVVSLSGNPGSYSINAAEFTDNPWAKIKVVIDDLAMLAVGESEYFVMNSPGNSPPMGWIVTEIPSGIVGDDQLLEWEIRDAENDPIFVDIILVDTDSTIIDTIVGNYAGQDNYIWDTRLFLNRVNVMIKYDFKDSISTTSYFSEIIHINNNYPYVSNEYFVHTNGASTSEVFAIVYDEGLLTNNDYTIMFSDEDQYNYTIRNMTTGLDIINESLGYAPFYTPVFDGIQVYIDNDITELETIIWEADTTHPISFISYLSLENRMPADYLIQFSQIGADTSLNGVIVPFQIFNTTNDSLNEISFNIYPPILEWVSLQQIWLYENEIPGFDPDSSLSTWRIRIGTPLSLYDWAPGDEIRIITNKRLRSNDIYSFRGQLNIENSIDGIPNKYSLNQNYPNPFNPATNIEFSLPKNEVVSISIYNLLGQNVHTLVNNQVYSAGNHEVIFNGYMLGSGLYFYRITTQDWTSTRKMILLK